MKWLTPCTTINIKLNAFFRLNLFFRLIFIYYPLFWMYYRRINNRKINTVGSWGSLQTKKRHGDGYKDCHEKAS